MDDNPVHTDYLLDRNDVMEKHIVDGSIAQTYVYHFRSKYCVFMQTERSCRVHVDYLASKMDDNCVLVPVEIAKAVINSYEWIYAQM